MRYGALGKQWKKVQNSFMKNFGFEKQDRFSIEAHSKYHNVTGVAKFKLFPDLLSPPSSK